SWPKQAFSFGCALSTKSSATPGDGMRVVMAKNRTSVQWAQRGPAQRSEFFEEKPNLRFLRSTSVKVAALVCMVSGGATVLAQTPNASLEERLAKMEAATTSAQSAGDNAWMLVCAALVLMMTGPGLALFYGGLVRKKNVLSTMMQSFVLMAVVSILWVIYGYSLAFAPGNSFV